MAHDVGSSLNSLDVEKQDDVNASIEGEVDKVPEGNAATNCCSLLAPKVR